MGASTPGIDVNSAVNAAVTAAEGPEDNWESQLTMLEDQTTALQQLQTDASNVDSDIQALNSLTGVLSQTTVSSSNSSVVTGSSVSGTASGNYVVEVGALAASDTWSSTSLPSDTTSLSPGTLTITSASGDPTTITIGSGVDTLSDLANTINGDDLGVTASVITDATGSQLSIVSNTSGSASDFTVSSSDPSSFGFSQVVSGTNASLTVNGISISSASNTVTGAVPGLTLNLLSTSQSPVTVSVSADTSGVTSTINQFVSDYNTLITAVNSQFSDSGSGQGVLADDPTVTNLQTALMQAVDYTYTPSSGTTTVPNLSALGITVNSDGTLSVDSTTLDDALQNNYSDVQSFFQGTSQNGFANALDQQLTNFTSSDNGAFTVDLQSVSSEETSLETDIDNFQSNVISPLETQLKSEYSQAEISLQELPGELKDVDEELGENNSSSNS
jgi:flagellar hook-associated protein 2